MRFFLVCMMGLIFLVAFAVDAHFEGATMVRTTTLDITYPENSLISYACPCCCDYYNNTDNGSDCGCIYYVERGDIVELTVTELTNRMGSTVYIDDADGYGDPAGISFTLTSPHEVEAGETADVRCVFDTSAASAGEYSVYITLEISWENGSADVPLCPIKIKVEPQHKTVWALPDGYYPFDGARGGYFQVCNSISAPLLSGGEVLGTLSVVRNETHVTVEATAMDGWILSQTHLYVGDVPPLPDQFGYSHTPFGERDTFVVPASGDTYVAFYAEVEN